MFVDLAARERGALLAESQPCLIPGYTGHCPTLKFRFGKRYGANTKDIIKEMKEKGVSLRHAPYHQREPASLQNGTNGRHSPSPGPEATGAGVREQGQTRDLALDVKHRPRRYILGYTGNYPGMHFRYGTSFRRAADDSVTEFSRRLAQEAARRERERAHRSRSAPKAPCIRSRDEVRAAIRQYEADHKYKDHHISPEFPPIAGYTGHIPRLRVTDASLSLRYEMAARQGLALLQQERERARQEAAERCTTPAM
ncbi:protein FAM166B-like [Schistocerca serialis cubense]|uniref:protein FAM166B-like n=1 Tax=Schistocerca serialis cubense TaxID=2023355 RepID=UPI00214EFBBF|nr:protein FAM166B-like [Schistocerca serialis cubense]